MPRVSTATLNTFKDVIRSRELSQATLEEIQIALQKQGIKDYKTVTIRRIAQLAGAVEYTNCISAEG